MNKPADKMLTEVFGAKLRPLPREEASAHGVKPGVGVVVDMVKPDSPAAKGGLRQGDVITEVDDDKAINPAQVATLLSIMDANGDFEITVRRGSENVDLDYEFDRAALDAMAAALTPDRAGPADGR